ncbi:MAG: DUF1566 domain-containing protein, partial [Candidatus Pacebacteria bacterium]|nr:DUF1566 domain-containing protein [Candidatus Paceibacterota bacterium]
QAELTYDVPGNYSTVCADTKVVSMLAAITGSSTSCLSYNNAGLSDVYLRWGASAIMGTSTPIQASSASQNGVGTWDVQGVNAAGAFVGTDVTMNWDTANAACATAGGRLPTLEELKTLSDATWAASTNTTHTPPSFVASYYWSSTTVPSNPAYAYGVNMATGNFHVSVRAGGIYVRCVR